MRSIAEGWGVPDPPAGSFEQGAIWLDVSTGIFPVPWSGALRSHRRYGRTSTRVVWISPFPSRVSIQSGWKEPSAEAAREW